MDMKYRIVAQGQLFACYLHNDDGSLCAWSPRSKDFRGRLMTVPATTDPMVFTSREAAVKWATQERGAANGEFAVDVDEQEEEWEPGDRPASEVLGP
jgi:hypothetical protein